MNQQTLTINDVAGGIGMVGGNVIKTMNGSKTQTRRVEACLKALGSRPYLPKETEHPCEPRYKVGKVYYVKEALERRSFEGFDYEFKTVEVDR